MTNVDQFESVFRSAAKEVFQYQRVEFASVLIVTDFESGEAYEYGEQIKSFLNVLNFEKGPNWDIVTGTEFDTIESLLDTRSLHTASFRIAKRRNHGMSFGTILGVRAHEKVWPHHVTLATLSHASARTHHIRNALQRHLE